MNGQSTEFFFGRLYFDATTVLGGIHKNILSKNFKGGDITIFMGGAEMNLSQADIQGTAALDITQIMGGTKIDCASELGSEKSTDFGFWKYRRQKTEYWHPRP